MNFYNVLLFFRVV